METDYSLNNSEKESLDNFLDQLDVKYRLVTAFLGGSLIEGWGNESSDIDILVFVESSNELQNIVDDIDSLISPRDSWVMQGSSVIVSSLLGDRRSDIEIHSVEGLNLAVSRLKLAGQPSSFPYLVKQYELELFRDLLVGSPLRHKDRFFSLKQQINSSLLCEVIQRQNAYEASAHLEDFQGAYSSGNLVSALLTSRSALGCAVDAWIAHQGHSNPKSKWRGMKLMDLGATEMLNEYLRLELCDSGSTEGHALLSSCKTRALAAQRILLFE